MSGFLALCLLNCSVDAPDATFSSTHEDLHYNEQESIVELVVEKCLGYDDAIPEFDDQDDEDTQGKKFSVDFFLIPVTQNEWSIVISEILKRQEYCVSSFPDQRPILFSPPPEA